MSASVTLKNLTISYARRPAVHHINGAFACGSMTAIAGPNGAGKSTLLKAIAGIITTYEGHIKIEGGVNPNIAYLSQASALQRDFPIDLHQMVSSGFWRQAGGFSSITSAMKDRVSQAINAVGLSGYEKRSLQTLSAGQFQRALFARLLIQDAPLILLDEPFTSIDAASTEHLLEMTLRWHNEGRTIICVLHDFDQIRRYFPSCLLMARECIAWGKSSEILSPEHLLKARFSRERPIAQPEICKQAV